MLGLGRGAGRGGLGSLPLSRPGPSSAVRLQLLGGAQMAEARQNPEIKIRIVHARAVGAASLFD